MKSVLRLLSGGATVVGDEAEFRVWAPNAEKVTLRLIECRHRDVPMDREPDGTFTAASITRPGDRYFYIVDQNQPVPDPVSRFLPEGVHGPTLIVDAAAFQWTDAVWRGVELADYVIYELHVGTFTRQGTFDGAIEKLEYLKSLGITVIEIMPVAAFPGKRNWGYDGVSLYAVQESYGGPDGLKRLVDAAHQLGLGVMLDVVYNHLGNEGNYLRLFGPYFSDHHHTPWGDAINYDAEGSAGVRKYFVENALYWISEYHLDGLRLDAVQNIYDDSPKHILAEIQEQVQALAKEEGRTVCMIAETDENDSRYVRSASKSGYGLDAVWSDDFHHVVHTLLTQEDEGYYQDFGKVEQLTRALSEGAVFQGEYFNFWKANRGTSMKDVPLPRNVFCIQNHEQVGNRALGDRLSTLVPRGACKLAAALLLLAPETPLLFMGEEYGETAPFQFFTDYGDPVLQNAVREGRRNEFKDFVAFGEEVPDPQNPQTFERSKLSWKLNSEMLDWYRQLLELRKQFVTPSDRSCKADARDGVVMLQVPAVNPKLRVIVRLPGSSNQANADGWAKALSSDEDGYAVEVWQRG